MQEDPPRHSPCWDTVASLARTTLADGKALWTSVAQAACSATRADAAGVVGVSDGRRLAAVGDAAELAAQLPWRLLAEGASGSDQTAGHDELTQSHFLIMRFGQAEMPTLLWALRRQAPFDWREANAFRSLGALSGLLMRYEDRVRETDVLRQESEHRCGNDLQLVSGLLHHQARAAGSHVVHNNLELAAARVMSLALARRAREGDLGAKLRQLGSAMGGNGVDIAVSARGDFATLNERRADYVLLAVNELLTNAIKHAFPDHQGVITICAWSEGGTLFVTVDDDGLPFPDAEAMRGGSGLGLIEQLIRLCKGRFSFPEAGSKTFRIEMPAS